MKENISVEATCCTHSLNETFRCLIQRGRYTAKLGIHAAIPRGCDND
jgi:hypothetical protein